MLAGMRADAEQAADVHKEDIGGFCCHNADHQRLSGNTGVGLRKDLARADAVENAFVAPEVVVFDRYAARKHHSERCDAITGVIDHIALLIVFFLCLEAFQYGLHLLRRGPPEQKGL